MTFTVTWQECWFLLELKSCLINFLNWYNSSTVQLFLPLADWKLGRITCCVQTSILSRCCEKLDIIFQREALVHNFWPKLWGKYSCVPQKNSVQCWNVKPWIWTHFSSIQHSATAKYRYLVIQWGVMWVTRWFIGYITGSSRLPGPSSQCLIGFPWRFDLCITWPRSCMLMMLTWLSVSGIILRRCWERESEASVGITFRTIIVSWSDSRWRKISYFSSLPCNECRGWYLSLLSLLTW